MSQHTKGPWKWTSGWAMGPSDKEGFSCVQNDDGELVIVSCDGCSLEPSVANAQLIAAAPELLEALKKCIEYIEGSDDNWFDGTDAYRWGCASIAKAEGREP